MISIIYDYIQYRFQIGKFGSKHLSKSFKKDRLEELWLHLRAGDILFVYTPNSFLSWIVMYVTNEPFSHVAMYAGGRKVSHMTTSGYSVDDVSIFSEKKCKILPIIAPIEKRKRDKFKETVKSLSDMPYGWGATIGKGLRIFFGRDYPRFKLKFVSDVVISLSALDLILYITYERMFLCWLLIPYFIVLARNIYKFKTGGYDFDFITGIHIYHGLIESGGRKVLDYGEINRDDTSFPSVITTDMYVFYKKDNSPDKDQLDKYMLDFGGRICWTTDLPEDDREMEYSCYVGDSKGSFKGQIDSYRSQARLLGYGKSQRFTHALKVVSSVDAEDMIAAIAFTCAFAKASDGVFHNPGLHMSNFSTAVLEVGNSLIETLREIDLKNKEKANYQVNKDASR